MNHPHGAPRHGITRARAVVVLCVAAALATGAVWSLWGCSVQKNFKTLNFFFDGVPDPNAPSKGPGSASALVDIQQSPTYSAHKPWVEEKCGDCHTRTLKLGNRDSDICLKCHSAKTSEHETMHGPVAVGACLWCHTPHNSAYASLLKAPAREVCSQCHVPAQLNSQRVPEHAQESRSCIECHDGHGGKERFFLRTAKTSSPAPPPDASPAP
jgi:predicted CXXCH cytochrome family protein